MLYALTKNQNRYLTVMTKQTGKFIVFEGCDYSGKSTVSAMITEWLKEQKIDALLTKHPGSTMIGKELRKIVKESSASIDENTEALIMASDNSSFINQILIPSLKSGAWVIGDRNNFISSMAYQIASGCSFAQLDKVHAATAENPPLIDLLLIFRINPEVHAERCKLRPKVKRDNFEDRGNAYTKKVINAYDNLLNEQSGRLLRFVKTTADIDVGDIPRCLYIDSNRPVEEVFEECKSIIKSML